VPRLRIVHVSDCYPPRLGGIEVQVAGLAEQQVRSGHEVHVVTASPGAPMPTPPVVHRITARLPFALPVHPRAGRHLTPLLERLRPDVVQVHVGAISPFAWAAARCAVRARLPLVVSVHSMWDPVTRGIYRALDGVFGWRRWPLVLAPVSRVAAEAIRQVVGPGTEVHVVSNGLQPDRWRPGRIDRNGAGPVRVVAVGRLAPRKQPIKLLRLLREAAARIGPDRAPLRATIVGDGPAEAAMRRYLHRHRMGDWVELTGRVDRDRLLEVLAGADVFLAPAVREAFGLAALEARTAGLPVVARRHTGIADFVTSGRNGLLADDRPGLVDALTRLATDHALRADIIANNRAAPPSAQSWPAVLAGLDRCYRQARAVLGEPVTSGTGR
jgi:glycosyltransferase involved in cell wall biosynthesis